MPYVPFVWKEHVKEWCFLCLHFLNYYTIPIYIIQETAKDGMTRLQSRNIIGEDPPRAKINAEVTYTGKISPPFYFRPFRPISWGRIHNWANWIIYKGLCNNNWDWANSKLGQSVSDLHRAKIRLGEFKSVYSNLRYCMTLNRQSKC